MTFRAQDLCKTTRRSQAGGPPRLYPRLLGDDHLTPRLGIAIRFFETNLGRSRADLDSQALVTLFGDAKLTRCLVSCLGQTYRYRAPRLAEVLGEERASALAGRGLSSPRDLRLAVYARANREGGYVPPAARAAWLDGQVEELSAADMEQVLWLDAPDRAILLREGPTPTAAELRARYNARLLETLLGLAPECQFALRGDRALVRAVAARYGVRTVIEGDSVALYGQADVFGSWARHGGRLARAVLTLLVEGVLGPGTVVVQLGERRYAVTIDATLLDRALPPRRWPVARPTWAVADALLRVLQTMRQRGQLAGWRVRRWPAALVTEQAIAWPEFALSSGDTTIGLLPLTAEQVAADGPALTALAARHPLVVVTRGRRVSAPAGLTVIRLDSRSRALPLAEIVAGALPAGAQGPATWLTALVDAARADGCVSEAELARRLDCAAEVVGARLAPVAETVTDVVYIDGFGLCTADFLDRAQAVVRAEAAGNDGRIELGRLGRRLRLLVGHNEGLHALIAHVGGEMRPTA